ncbi:hypothetical protein Tco_0647612, partial [Tanacetum coccineum]
VEKEAITFNLDQTSRYSSNHNDNSVNRIDVIEMAYEEYSQEVLGFSDVIAKTPTTLQLLETSTTLQLHLDGYIYSFTSTTNNTYHFLEHSQQHFNFNMKDNIYSFPTNIFTKQLWAWDLNGDGDFCVKDARDLVDEVLLPKENVATRLIKTILIKVNVFAWKLHLDRLPTRSNLLKRGIQLFLALYVDGGTFLGALLIIIRAGWSGLILFDWAPSLKGS